MQTMASISIAMLSLLLLFSAAPVQAKIRHHRWDIKYESRSPDCFQKPVITINGEFPGPAISAQQGDTIIVDAKNLLLTENLAIHFHGIRQIGTPWSDGAEGVTQCPILPGETFTYKFIVDEPGTYFYHAHYGMLRSAGLHGIIHVAASDGVVEPFTYDYDRSIILNDWWHKSATEQAMGLSLLPFTWVGEPQSLLINGRGKFNRSLPGTAGVCNLTSPDCSPYVLTVVPGKTYRLRIISVASLSALNFQIEGHNMTVVAADGHYVKPFVVNDLNIYSGETYSVILKANADSARNYWMAISVVSRRPSTPTGTAILNYHPNRPSRPPPTAPPRGPQWNNTAGRLNQSVAIRAHPDYIQPPPSKSDRVIILLNTQNKIDGHIRWSVNNVSFNLPETPYLIALKKKLNHVFDQKILPDIYDYKGYDIYSVPKNPNATYGNAIYRLKFNSTVDVILQNSNKLSPNDTETHPWHLHGHNFWVLGYGVGKFDPMVDPNSYNLIDPIMKNTVPVHHYGWTALRFRADNPGVWALHCHVESHFFLGMGVVFEEGVERVGKLPTAIMGCGKSRLLVKP